MLSLRRQQKPYCFLFAASLSNLSVFEYFQIRGATSIESHPSTSNMVSFTSWHNPFHWVVPDDASSEAVCLCPHAPTFQCRCASTVWSLSPTVSCLCCSLSCSALVHLNQPQWKSFSQFLKVPLWNKHWGWWNRFNEAAGKPPVTVTCFSSSYLALIMDTKMNLHIKYTDFYPELHFSHFPPKIACKSSRSFFQIDFYLDKIMVYPADLYFKHDSWRSRAFLPVEAAAEAAIDQFPWLQTLDTATLARQSKSADDIIRSATFPAAHAPSPDDSSQSEGIGWPYALPVLGTVSSGWACSLCCLLAVHRALCHSLAALISLQQRLNCIPASLWAPLCF